MWKGAVWAADVSSGSPSSTSVKCGSRHPSSSASTAVAPCGETHDMFCVCSASNVYSSTSVKCVSQEPSSASTAGAPCGGFQKVHFAVRQRGDSQQMTCESRVPGQHLGEGGGPEGQQRVEVLRLPRRQASQEQRRPRHHCRRLLPIEVPPAFAVDMCYRVHKTAHGKRLRQAPLSAFEAARNVWAYVH